MQISESTYVWNKSLVKWTPIGRIKPLHDFLRFQRQSSLRTQPAVMTPRTAAAAASKRVHMADEDSGSEPSVSLTNRDSISVTVNASRGPSVSSNASDGSNATASRGPSLERTLSPARSLPPLPGMQSPLKKASSVGSIQSIDEKDEHAFSVSESSDRDHLDSKYPDSPKVCGARMGQRPCALPLTMVGVRE